MTLQASTVSSAARVQNSGYWEGFASPHETFDAIVAAVQTGDLDAFVATMTEEGQDIAARHPDMIQRYVDTRVRPALERGWSLGSEVESTPTRRVFERYLNGKVNGTNTFYYENGSWQIELLKAR